MRKFSFFLALMFLIACSTEESKSAANCTAVENPDCFCLQVYEPVCGCDGLDYPNSCYAACNGIVNYEEGECP